MSSSYIIPAFDSAGIDFGWNWYTPDNGKVVHIFYNSAFACCLVQSNDFGWSCLQFPWPFLLLQPFSLPLEVEGTCPPDSPEVPVTGVGDRCHFATT
jgi:hypothetical protein